MKALLFLLALVATGCFPERIELPDFRGPSSRMASRDNPEDRESLDNAEDDRREILKYLREARKSVRDFEEICGNWEDATKTAITTDLLFKAQKNFRDCESELGKSKDHVKELEHDLERAEKDIDRLKERL